MATHLTATQRAIRAFERSGQVSIEAARDQVQDLALRRARGTSTERDGRLIDKLEKACGCSLAELATFADDWI